MKKARMALALAAAVCLLTAGCSGQQGDVSSQSAEPAESAAGNSAASDALSVSGYQMVRDVFVEQYRNTSELIQKQVASFNAGDDWWAGYDALKQSISSVSNTFFSNESKIPSECRQDFETLKSATALYTQAIEKTDEAYGKTADEQMRIIAEAANLFNQANAGWKQQVQTLSSASAGSS